MYTYTTGLNQALGYKYPLTVQDKLRLEDIHTLLKYRINLRNRVLIAEFEQWVDNRNVNIKMITYNKMLNFHISFSNKLLHINSMHTFVPTSKT